MWVGGIKTELATGLSWSATVGIRGKRFKVGVERSWIQITRKMWKQDERRSVVNALAPDAIVDFAVVAGNEISLAVEPGTDADAVAGKRFVVIPPFPTDGPEFRRVARFGSGPDIGASLEVGFDGTDAVAFARKGEVETWFLPPGLFGMDNGDKDVGDFSVPPRREQFAFHEVDGDIGGTIGRKWRIGDRFVEPTKIMMDEGNRIADGNGLQTENAEKGQVEKGKRNALP